MPLISSGQISIEDIYTELGNSNIASAGGVSLSALEGGAFGIVNTSSPSTPDGAAPHAMSEWFSYDHSAGGGGGGPTLQSFLSDGPHPESAIACQFDPSTTRYHNGSGVLPVVADTVYEDSAGAIPSPSGWYTLPFSQNMFLDDGSQVVVVGSCGKSERRLKYNIEFVGNSPMGIPMYHFNYKNEKDGVGRFIGTMVDDLQRLGFEDALIYGEDAIYVNYSKIDVPFENVK